MNMLQHANVRGTVKREPALGSLTEQLKHAVQACARLVFSHSAMMCFLMRLQGLTGWPLSTAADGSHETEYEKSLLARSSAKGMKCCSAVTGSAYHKVMVGQEHPLDACKFHSG